MKKNRRSSAKKREKIERREEIKGENSKCGVTYSAVVQGSKYINSNRSIIIMLVRAVY